MCDVPFQRVKALHLKQTPDVAAASFWVLTSFYRFATAAALLLKAFRYPRVFRKQLHVVNVRHLPIHPSTHLEQFVWRTNFLFHNDASLASISGLLLVVISSPCCLQRAPHNSPSFTLHEKGWTSEQRFWLWKETEVEEIDLISLLCWIDKESLCLNFLMQEKAALWNCTSYFNSCIPKLLTNWQLYIGYKSLVTIWTG